MLNIVCFSNDYKFSIFIKFAKLYRAVFHIPFANLITIISLSKDNDCLLQQVHYI